MKDVVRCLCNAIDNGKPTKCICTWLSTISQCTLTLQYKVLQLYFKLQHLEKLQFQLSVACYGKSVYKILCCQTKQLCLTANICPNISNQLALLCNWAWEITKCCSCTLSPLYRKWFSFWDQSDLGYCYVSLCVSYYPYPDLTITLTACSGQRRIIV